MTQLDTHIRAAFVVLSAAALAAGEPGGREVVETGWVETWTAGSWRPEPWLVRSADPEPAGLIGGDGATFRVAAGRAMAWTRTVDPIWVADFPWLAATLEIECIGGSGGLPGQAAIRLSDDATGPITPGALNPENPEASGGGGELALPAAGGPLVADVRTAFQRNRIARISLVVHAGAAPARVRLRSLQFLASDPRQPPAGPATRPARPWFEAAPDLLPPPGRWQSIELPPDRAISADWLGRALGTAGDWPVGRSAPAGIPFELAPAPRAALATGVSETNDIEITGRWRGSQLGLLLGTRVFGSRKPSYSSTLAPESRPLTSPHELRVRLRYADGAEHTTFLWSLLRREWSVDRPVQPYVVPVDAGRELVAIRVEDRMTYGQVFLIAASINTDRTAALDLTSPPAKPPSGAATRPRPRDGASPPAGQTVTLSNPRVRLALTLGSGPVLQELECVDRPRRLRMSSRLIDVQDEQGRSVPLTLRERSSAASGDALDAAWALSETTDIRLAIRLQPDGRIRLTPSIANHAARPLVVTVAAPLLAGIRIAGEPDDCWYLLGTRGLILDNRPLKVQRTYCGEYPLQIVDLFAPRAGGGLGLMIEDDQLAWKTFAFEQAAGTATVAVRYPGVTVPASQTVTLPAAMLIPHTGDWHELFDASRRQLRRGPLGAGRMRDLFYCRRDYPLGGTGYLFDPARRAYTPLALIEESRRGLGGIDMIDISGWALHEKTGRVGDYLTNDLGGLDGLRRGIDAAHAAGVSVGLYTEGYLVDRRAPLAARALPAWQMIDHGGKPRWWAGEMEFFTCPGVADWREALSSMIAGAVRTTGADAVYLDEFGFCGPDKQCWSADHGHAVPSNPMIEESRMLAAVRAALDAHTPHVGIYIEQTPCDAMAHRVDAAFNYGMSAAGPQHPTGLPLMRFVFPELVTVEMVSQGIHPLPVSEADLHRCLFNGLAIWLKGRSESWYSPGFRDTARRAYAILDRHRDLFRSPDCDPLVPTLAPGIYANRFRTEAATLLTLYNARPTPCTGPLVEVFLPAGSRVQDLWSRQPLDIRRAAAGDAAVIAGSLEPHSVGLLLVTSEAASRPSADSPDRP